MASMFTNHIIKLFAKSLSQVDTSKKASNKFNNGMIRKPRIECIQHWANVVRTVAIGRIFANTKEHCMVRTESRILWTIMSIWAQEKKLLEAFTADIWSASMVSQGGTRYAGFNA